MNMMTMNADSLTKMLGSPVDSMVVLIAKNEVSNLDSATIAQLLGVEVEEIREVQETQVYKDVRLLLGAEHAKGLIEADLSWDALEQMALANLIKVVPSLRAVDADLSLKIAAVANRAQRRLAPQQSKILDPAAGGQRVALNLTQRFVTKLNRDGSKTTEETRQISVMDGSASNPTIQDIDKLLGVSARPRIASRMAIHTHDPDFTIDDIKLGGE